MKKIFKSSICYILGILLVGCQVNDSTPTLDTSSESVIISESSVISTVPEYTFSDSALTSVDDELVLGNGTKYYISDSTGNDSNDGLSPETAWKSVKKVNYDHNTYLGKTLLPGDTVFLKAGDVFPNQLSLNGNSTAANPITITRYGEGAKPKLLVPKSYNGIELKNSGGFVIDNLEIELTATSVNPTSGSQLDGIVINYTAVEHYYDIVIQNCDIHGRTSQIKARGINIFCTYTWDDYAPNLEMKDILTNVLIRRNKIYNFGIVGFSTAGWNTTINGNYTGREVFKNVIFTENEVYQIGILGAFFQNTTGGLFTKNLIYETGQLEKSASWGSCGMMVLASEDVVIQNNISRDNLNASYNHDGVGFDIDWSSFNVILKYNEAYGNIGSGISTMSNQDCKIINNKVWGNASKFYASHAQINLTDYQSDHQPKRSEGVQNMEVSENLVIVDVPETNGIGSTIYSHGPWTGNTVLNNSVVMREKAHVTMFKADAGVDVIENNRYWYNDVNDFLGQTDSADIYGWDNWQKKYDKQGTLNTISSQDVKPSPLSQLDVAYNSATHKLSFTFNNSVDNFWHYNIHQSLDEDFTPNYINLLDWVYTNNYEVEIANSGEYYFAVNTENYIGNNSQYSYIKVVID